mgnify:FL=1
MALTEIPIELSSTPSIVDGGNATAITISSAELVTVANGLTLTDGNVVVAAGHGIDFSATSGSGTSELLDDYEEGSFTATYVGSTTAGSSPSVTGYYTKIGRLVTVTITQDNFTSTSAAGNLLYTGLPFAASSAGGYHGAVGVTANISAATLVSSVLSGTSYIQVRNANTTVFTPVVNTSGMYFLTTISYMTDL